MNSSVFLGQRYYILLGVFILLFFDISTKISVKCVFAFLSSHNQPFPLNFVSKSMTNNVSIITGLSYPWVKMEFTIENMFFKDVGFIAVKISKCFSFILNIGPDKSRIRIKFLHNFFSFKIILLWVLVPKMIILNRCSKKQVLSACTHRSSILHQLSFRHNISIIVMGNKEDIIIVAAFFQIVQSARFIQIQLDLILCVIDLCLQTIESVMILVGRQQVKEGYFLVLFVFCQLEDDI